MNKSVTVFGLTFPLAFAAMAGVFPHAGGDLASTGDDGWGGPVPTEETLEINQPGTYTLSANTSFMRLYISAAETLFDFSDGNHTLTISENNQYSFQTVNSNRKVTFKGGAVEFTGGSGTKFQLSSGTTYHDNHLLLDGTSMTGPQLFSVGYAGSYGNSAVLTNGASLTTPSIHVSDNGGHDNVLEINAGCTVSSGDVFSDQYGSRADGDSSLIRVRGAGAVLKEGQNNRTVYLGYRHDDNMLTVEDGGQVNFFYVYFGAGNGSNGTSINGNNTLNILSGGSVKVNQLVMGNYSHDNLLFISNGTFQADWSTQIGLSGKTDSSNNRFVMMGSEAIAYPSRFRLGGDANNAECSAAVCDGATLSASTIIEVGQGGAFCSLAVTNATVLFGQLNIGNTVSASNCAVRLHGPQTVFGSTTSRVVYDSTFKGFFGKGGNGLIELSGGCTNSFAEGSASGYGDPYLGYLSSGNVIRLLDRSAWLPQYGMLEVGHASTGGDDVTTRNNRIEIGDGCRFQNLRTFVHGQDNGIVISNGTMHLESTMWNSLVLGQRQPEELAEETSGNYLRLEGDHPKLTGEAGSTSLWLRNGSVLKFVLPATPYAEAPIQCGSIDIDDTTNAIEIDTSAVDATTHGSLVYTLADIYSAEYVSKLNPEVLANTNARLADRKARVYWDGKQLKCRIGGNRGMTILLR